MSISLNHSDKWMKAAVLGTSWAASEIVFGSFLHNLRVPFSGNILTSVGLIILISASYKWKDTGLFWRAGIITALMKSASPSAIIFGPMIAIFVEALLFELSVRLLGRSFLGFVVGAILAMSWVLFQRIINLVIFYGSDIVEIYTQLMKMAEKNIHIQTDLVWLPIFLLLGVHILMAIAATLIGMKAGRNLINGTVAANVDKLITKHIGRPKADPNFNYSGLWLILNPILIVGMLFMLSLAPVWLWILLTILLIFIWALRYKSALRHLSKPKFWIFFVFITMIAAFTFTSLQLDADSLKSGFIIGLQMNFRAAIIIIGFSTIGKELYNPKVMDFFRRSSYSQLHLALELSFSSVPQVIAALPTVREFIKNPLLSVSALLENADRQIQFYRAKNDSNSRVILINGDIDSGKSRLCHELISQLRNSEIVFGGIITEKIIENDHTLGYDVLNIKTQEKHPLLRLNTENNEGIGRFKIIEEGFKFGIKIIENESLSSKVLILDEAGKLEIEGKGWADSLNRLLTDFDGYLIITLRKRYLEEFIQHWNLKPIMIVEVETENMQNQIRQILESIGKSDLNL